MKPFKVHVELLLGREIHDSEGARVGRIVEIQAEREGDAMVVREYHLGTAALLARLGISAARLTGFPMKREPLRIPWDQMDLSDPAHLRLRCRVDEIKKPNPQPRA